MISNTLYQNLSFKVFKRSCNVLVMFHPLKKTNDNLIPYFLSNKFCSLCHNIYFVKKSNRGQELNYTVFLICK